LTLGYPSDHVYAIVRTSSRVTHVVHEGVLVPAGTRLVAPGLKHFPNSWWGLLSHRLNCGH